MNFSLESWLERHEPFECGSNRSSSARNLARFNNQDCFGFIKAQCGFDVAVIHGPGKTVNCIKRFRHTLAYLIITNIFSELNFTSLIRRFDLRDRIREGLIAISSLGNWGSYEMLPSLYFLLA